MSLVVKRFKFIFAFLLLILTNHETIRHWSSSSKTIVKWDKLRHLEDFTLFVSK